MIDVESDTRVIEFENAIKNGNLNDAFKLSGTLSSEMSASDYYYCFNHMLHKYMNTDFVGDIVISMWKDLEPWTHYKLKDNRFIKSQINTINVQRFVDYYINFSDCIHIVTLLEMFHLWDKISDNTITTIMKEITANSNLALAEDIVFVNAILSNPYCCKKQDVLVRCIHLLSTNKITFEDIRSVFEKYHSDGKTYSFRLLIYVMESDISLDVKKWFIHSFCDDPYKVTFIANKSYSKSINDRQKEMLKSLVLAPVAHEEKIFLYFNSKMKTVFPISDLIEMFIKFTDFDVLSRIRDFWFSGCIKYVKDDGFVRIVPDTVSFELLPAFNSDSIRINDLDNSYCPPKEGLEVAFKILDYFPEKRLFFVHYVCTADYYKNNYSALQNI